MTSSEKTSLRTLLKKQPAEGVSPVALLQDIQGLFGYLPHEALQQVSVTLDVPLSKLFSIATFYNSFSLEPQGKHSVCVCLGTACHVKSGEGLLHKISRDLGLDGTEGTTADRTFTLKKVRCLGCCSLAPVVKIDDDIYGNMTQAKTSNLLKHYRRDRKR